MYAHFCHLGPVSLPQGCFGDLEMNKPEQRDKFNPGLALSF